MLCAPRMVEALEAVWDRFVVDDTRTSEALQVYRGALANCLEMNGAEIRQRLGDSTGVGALPTAEHDLYPGRVPFSPHFEHHQEARAWAVEVLKGTSTVAVDGSQIKPTKDYSIPVGVAQVGWFLNPHNPDRPYEKGVRAVVLPPDEMRASIADESFLTMSAVDLRRFQMEIDQAIYLMREHSGEPMVVFFDGSLVLSFTEQFPYPLRQQYVQAVMRLLLTSAETAVPVVGYLDTSYARDLCVMLSLLCGLDDHPPISDATVVRGMLQWGDRTPLYHCARAGILDQYLDPEWGDYREGICFTYLQAASGRPPARLEIPRWVMEAGQQEWLFDIVRAEIIAGACGYPYPIEAADAVAVLTIEDRERFYQLLEGFASQRGVALSGAAKARSKRRRRV